MEYQRTDSSNGTGSSPPKKVWEQDETILRYIQSVFLQSIVLMQKNILTLKGKILPSLSRLLTPAIFMVGLFIIQYAFRTETVYEEAHQTFDQPDWKIYVGYVENNIGNISHSIKIMERFADNNDMSIQTFGSNEDCKETICYKSLTEATYGKMRDIVRESELLDGNVYGMIVLGYGTRDFYYMGKRSTNIGIFTNGTKFSRNPYFTDPNAGTIVDYYIPISREYSRAEAELGTDEEDPKIIDVNFNVYKGASQNSFSLSTDFVLHALIGMVVFMSLYFTNISTHYDLNDEFHNELRENMDMMGLKRTSYWISTVCHHASFCIIGTLMMIGLGYAFQWNFFLKCNFFIICIVFFAINFSIFTNFLCLSRCCRSSRTSYCWNFFYFLVVLCIIFIFAPLAPRTDLGIGSAPIGYFFYIAGNGAIAVNIMIPLNYGKLLADITYYTQDIYNISQNKWVDNVGYSFTDFFNKQVPLVPGALEIYAPQNYINFLFVLFHIVFNIICIWYLDHVVPTKNGNRKPIWFCFLPSYWCKQRITSRSGLAVDVAEHKQGKFSSILPSTDKDIYREYQSVIKSLDTDVNHEEMPLKILDFNKTYSSLLGSHSRNTTAVSNLTLGGEKGQVLVLLGHNGAGKTTTIKMLTGLCAPSGGDAVIFGHSVVNNIESVRRSMGVVLQHDILFPELTAYQHMRLFCLLKGIPIRMLSNEIKEKLQTVKLWKFRNQLAKTFSGGMKRRLSVAISIIGDPKIIFMDEPSSGMDVYSKRHIWDLVAKLKKDRMIVLTTHAMEEAEAMGDKIAIMALGQLRAVGTIIHLKQRYGAGYSIDMITKKPQDLKDQVKDICPAANIETEASGIITYSLKGARRNDITKLLKYLEDQAKIAKSTSKESVLVQDFLMSYTTLSEVFLRITHGGNMEFDNFEDQRTTTHHNGQLNILIENHDEALGFVEVDSTTTLGDVRNLIRQYIDGTPKFYCFLSKGVRLPFRYEPSKFALDFLPLIVLKPISEDEAMGRSVVKPSSTTIPNPSDAQIHQLQQEVQRRDEIIEQLRAQIAALQNSQKAEI